MGARRGGGPEPRKSGGPKEWWPKGWEPEPRKSGGPKGWGPEGLGARRVGGPKGGGPEGWGARRVGGRRVGGPKFRAFFLSPAGNFILSSLSGGLLVEFWFFEAPGP